MPAKIIDIRTHRSAVVAEHPRDEYRDRSDIVPAAIVAASVIFLLGAAFYVVATLAIERLV